MRRFLFAVLRATSLAGTGLKFTSFAKETAARTGKSVRAVTLNVTQGARLRSGTVFQDVASPIVRKWNERPLRVFSVVVRGGGLVRSYNIGGAVLRLGHLSATRRTARRAPQIDLHEHGSHRKRD